MEVPLSHIRALNRAELAQRMAQQKNWRLIGLCFEDTRGFIINLKSLQAKNPCAADTTALCEDLLEELVERNITVGELAAAMKKSIIGMNRLAEELSVFYQESTAPASPSCGTPIQQKSSEKTLVNKYIFLAHSSEELVEKLHKSLQTYGFRIIRREHNLQLWQYTLPLDVEFYVLSLPLQPAVLPRLHQLLQYAGKVLFLTIHEDGEDTSTKMTLTLDDLKQHIYFAPALQSVLKDNLVAHDCYSVHKSNLKVLEEDVPLTAWITPPKPTSPYSFCLIFKLKETTNVRLAMQAVHDAFEQECGKPQQTSPGHGSTNIYILFPSPFMPLVLFKEDILDEHLRKRGFELISIEQAFLKDVREALKNPTNWPYLEQLYELYCDMELNGVPQQCSEAEQRFERQDDFPTSSAALSGSALNTSVQHNLAISEPGPVRAFKQQYDRLASSERPADTRLPYEVEIKQMLASSFRHKHDWHRIRSLSNELMQENESLEAEVQENLEFLEKEDTNCLRTEIERTKHKLVLIEQLLVSLETDVVRIRKRLSIFIMQNIQEEADLKSKYQDLHKEFQTGENSIRSTLETIECGIKQRKLKIDQLVKFQRYTLCLQGDRWKFSHSVEKNDPSRVRRLFDSWTGVSRFSRLVIRVISWNSSQSA